MIQKTLRNSLLTLVGVSLFSGCSQFNFPVQTHTPKEQTKVAKKVYPPELRLSSKSVDTSKKATATPQEHYNLTVHMNNTNKSTAMIKLYNVGGSPLSLSNIKMQDATKEKLFSLSSSCGKTIQPYKKCNLKIVFSGKNMGTFTSKIIIDSDSQGKVGKVGTIKIIAQGKNLLTGIISPIKMKKDTLGSKEHMQKFTFSKKDEVHYAELKNNGLSDITINSITLQGTRQFKYTHDCPKILKPAQTCELNFTYTKRTIKPALGYIVVESNGAIFPSDTIRLKGLPVSIVVEKKAPEILKLAAKDDMSIEISSLIVIDNIERFLEDSSKVKATYYVRTMYQNSVNPNFKDFYEHMIRYHFKKNGYKLAKNAYSADKIINLYPSIQMGITNNNELRVTTDIRANIVTKGSKATDSSQKVHFTMEQVAKGYSDEYFALAGITNNLASFMFNLLGLEE